MLRRIAYASLLSLSPLIACGSDSSNPASTSVNGCSAANAVVAATIAVVDYKFIPACVKVATGSSLTFVNQGATAHTVSSDAGAPNTFDNLGFGPGDSVTQPFVTSGATGIHCDYHSQMTMTVIAQ